MGTDNAATRDKHVSPNESQLLTDGLGLVASGIGGVAEPLSTAGLTNAGFFFGGGGGGFFLDATAAAEEKFVL